MPKRCSWLPCGFIAILAFSSCKRDESQHEGIVRDVSSGNRDATLAPYAGGCPERALDLWMKGRQSEAVDELVKVDWSRPNLFSPESSFHLKESQIQSMSSSERSIKINDAIATLNNVRSLCKHILQSSPAGTIDRKSYDHSERQLQTVRAYGQALDRPDGLVINRLAGLAIQKVALEKLMALYAANDRAKLAAVQEESQKVLKQYNMVKSFSMKNVQNTSKLPPE